MGYEKQNWIDHIEDSETGEIFQEGTLFTAKRMNHIEEGIYQASSQIKDNELQLEHVAANIYGVKNIKEYEHLVTDNDWIKAFEQATIECNANGYDLYIPSGTYPISKTWYIPSNVRIYGSGQKSRIIANAQMCANSLNSSCAVISLDNKGQEVYKFSHMYIGAETSNNNLNGLHIGGSRCSEFSQLVIQNLGGSGVLIYPTHENSGDLENFSVKHVWTNKVNEGLTIKTNNNIQRGHITDGQVMYCQFTTLDDTYVKNSGHAINIQGASGRYMFGLTFNRCFTHTRSNSLVNIANETGSIVYDLHFKHIKGELWGKNGLGDDVSNVYCLQIKNLRSSSFTDSFLHENNSKGVYLSKCKYNKFENYYWNYPVNPTSKYFYLDENCAFNSLNINVENAYYESNDIYASCAFDLFKKQIVDLGYSNFVYNSSIKNQVKLINEPSKIFDVSNKLLTNYNETSRGYEAELIDGALKITLKANVQDARVLIPINLKGLKHASCYLKYKVESDNFVDVLQAGISGLSKDLKKDNEEHELCVAFDNSVFEYNYYYIRCLSGQSLSNDVVITIYDWEIYEGFTIPYLPNYTCIQ